MKFILKLIANFYVIIGLLLLITPILYLAYREFTKPDKVQAEYQPEIETEILTEEIANEDIEFDGSKKVSQTLTVATKSDTQFIQIPAIGVDTRIYEGDETALEKGIWRMPIHGYPYDIDKSTVLSGHRWGPDNLSNEYRGKHLFYKLPELRPGDEIKIKWDNVEYDYKVIKIEENKYVSELTDLILITCKYYNSPIRIFVYAQKV